MRPPAANPNRIALAEAASPLLLLGPPAAVTAFMWLTRANDVEAAAVVFGHLILQLAWTGYVFWKRERRPGLPVFGIVASMYWIYFTVALFWGDRVLATARLIPIQEESVTSAVEMAFIAVLCLGIGMRVPLELHRMQEMPDIDERSGSSWVYLRVVMIAGTLLGTNGRVIYFLGPEGRQIMLVLTSIVPTVAFVLLLRRYWMGKGSLIDKPLLIAVGAARVVGALASGWLGPVVSLGLTITALFVVIHRRVPWAPILLTIAAILFFQVGKEEFRAVYWGSGAQDIEDANTSALERLKFWTDTSASQWSDALQAGGQAKPGQLASRTVQRASLLTQVSHVLELTPSQVPFQDGQTYSYLAITLIPRLFWPDKPSANDANRFYQVAYGLSSNKEIESTSIAVGCMAEGFINFGWPGVIAIMCGIGVLLKVYERGFVNNSSNTLLLALGVALLPQFLSIESQMAMYVGGLVQQVGLGFLAFLPISRRTVRAGLRANRLTPVSVRVRG